MENIYYVSIYKNETGAIHDIYYGVAENHQEALDKAVALAKSEGLAEPVVGTVKREGKRAF